MSLDIENKIDRIKTKLWMLPDMAIMAMILCHIQIEILDDETLPVAGTDNVSLYLNKARFFDLPENDQLFIICHELWHLAKMHPLRRESRNKMIWNIACDYWINQMLHDDLRMNLPEQITLLYEEYKFRGKSEEEIYNIIYQEAKNNSNGSGDLSDLPENELEDLMDCPEEHKKQAVINIQEVIQAAAQMEKPQKNYGRRSVLGELYEFLMEYCKPKIKWNLVLRQFITELVISSEKSWARPHRRYLPHDIYMPSNSKEPGKLAIIDYFIDVSGSVSKEQIEEFLTEAKYIHDTLQPDVMNIFSFDTEILQSFQIRAEDSFKKLDIHIGGGTSYSEVLEQINKDNPRVAIIFTDLYCDPMKEPDKKNPIIWICNNKDPHTVLTGKIYLFESNYNE